MPVTCSRGMGCSLYVGGRALLKQHRCMGAIRVTLAAMTSPDIVLRTQRSPHPLRDFSREVEHQTRLPGEGHNQSINSMTVAQITVSCAVDPHIHVRMCRMVLLGLDTRPRLERLW